MTIEQEGPPWIEHDGSDVCPVPAGHEFEAKYDRSLCRLGFYRGVEAQDRRWDWITHYRDWTAWEQRKAVAGEVPEWAWDRLNALCAEEGPLPSGGWNRSLECTRAFARYIAAHEQPPVDPLREIANAIRDEWNEGTAGLGDAAYKVLRARLPQAALDALGGGE